MLKAILKGKLSRDIEGMEDVLTSCIFGVAELLPPSDFLLPWLRKAVSIGGDLPLSCLLDQFTNSCQISYEYWPMLSEGKLSCEPDVVLEIEEDGLPKLAILVEAKFKSDLSSIGESREDGSQWHQLAREWHCFGGSEAGRDRKRFLVYLTADLAPPRDKMDDAIRKSEDRSQLGEHLLWLSWRSAYPILNRANQHLAGTGLRDLMLDGAQLLERLFLTPFEGFQPALRLDSSNQELDWSYTK